MCRRDSDYDKEIEDEDPPPIFEETLEGETLLGGEMRIRAPWAEENEWMENIE